MAAAAAAGGTVDPSRVRRITTAASPIEGRKSVVYWMHREQRADDNWALLHARELAAGLGPDVMVKVVFALPPKWHGGTLRHNAFGLAGLRATEITLRDKQIPFVLLRGSPAETVPAFVAAENPAVVVTDLHPLREPTAWVGQVGAALDALAPAVPLLQVDAHNIVPVWVASPKQEYMARTFRPKITGLLPRYLTEFPDLCPNAGVVELPKAVDWVQALATLDTDRSVPKAPRFPAGSAAAHAALQKFITERLNVYHDKSNNPNEQAQSEIAPYLNFGQLAPQRAALLIKRATQHAKGKSDFMEQLVVRRELTDNYCFYNDKYDSIEGASDWAQDSLALHAEDKREYLYTRPQLEAADTHDPLWNAAQRQMAAEGKMHGFMRMYWAKKILEWTTDPATALADAIYLNDKFSLDGNDPNGYVGCMWSICGVHDMGWKERPVFGKVRYMNYNGCKRKFDVKAFEARYSGSTAKSGGIASFFGADAKKRKGGTGAASGRPAKKLK